MTQKISFEAILTFVSIFSLVAIVEQYKGIINYNYIEIECFYIIFKEEDLSRNNCAYGFVPNKGNSCDSESFLNKNLINQLIFIFLKSLWKCLIYSKCSNCRWNSSNCLQLASPSIDSTNDIRLISSTSNYWKLLSNI